MHEGVAEDGSLATCGICGSEVHMLNPEEMDWICDPCSLAGWSGFKSAWKLVPGDVCRIGKRTVCITQSSDFGKFVWLDCRDEDGSAIAFVQRQTRKVYVHMDRQPV